jgi:hypothetical protein
LNDGKGWSFVVTRSVKIFSLESISNKVMLEWEVWSKRSKKWYLVALYRRLNDLLGSQEFIVVCQRKQIVGSPLAKMLTRIKNVNELTQVEPVVE